MKAAIDHLMWACADLEAGSAHIESLTGGAPRLGGPHPGFGTRNALLHLGDQSYLEIIAPDPGQSLQGNLGGELCGLDAPYLRAWALRVEDIGAARDSLESLGIESRGPTSMSRALPSGELIGWELLFLGDGFVGGALPFFIDWKGSTHPCAGLEPACELATLEIETPDIVTLERVVRGFELELEPRAGTVDRLRATISSPRGSIVLQ